MILGSSPRARAPSGRHRNQSSWLGECLSSRKWIGASPPQAQVPWHRWEALLACAQAVGCLTLSSCTKRPHKILLDYSLSKKSPMEMTLFWWHFSWKHPSIGKFWNNSPSSSLVIKGNRSWSLTMGFSFIAVGTSEWAQLEVLSERRQTNQNNLKTTEKKKIPHLSHFASVVEWQYFCKHI